MGEIRCLFRDLFLAVSYCQNLGIAHRDLKFENCLIVRDGKNRRHGKVIDFGLSAIRKENDELGKWLNEQLGTCCFVAPEVIDKSVPYGVKCDLWSIGVMVYMTLTDEHPCVLDHDIIQTHIFFKEVMRNKVRKEPLEEANVSPSARDLVFKLLDKNPLTRLRAPDALALPWLKVNKDKRPTPFANIVPLPSKKSTGPMSKVVAIRLSSFVDRSCFERAVLTLVAHHTPCHEVEQFRAQFVALDKDSSGHLTKDEVGDALKMCGIVLEPEDLEELFDALDTNRTGTITYTEWLAATLDPSMLAAEGVMDQIYKFFDIDGNGEVCKTELTHVLGNEKAAEEVLERSDKNDDEFLTEAEFKALLTELVYEMTRHDKEQQSITPTSPGETFWQLANSTMSPTGLAKAMANSKMTPDRLARTLAKVGSSMKNRRPSTQTTASLASSNVTHAMTSMTNASQKTKAR